MEFIWQKSISRRQFHSFQVCNKIACQFVIQSTKNISWIYFTFHLASNPKPYNFATQFLNNHFFYSEKSLNEKCKFNKSMMNCFFGPVFFNVFNVWLCVCLFAKIIINFVALNSIQMVDGWIKIQYKYFTICLPTQTNRKQSNISFWVGTIIFFSRPHRT